MAPGNRRIRAVVADDSRTALRSICEYLEFAELFEILGTAADGRHLLQQAERLRPDLVLTDLHMPRMTGLEAAKELRKSFPELRIVLFTAQSCPSLREDSLQSGVDGVVEKSQIPDGLMEEVRRLFPGIAGRV
jgi:DNA-binding NarL/FixJ family response regulator